MVKSGLRRMRRESFVVVTDFSVGRRDARHASSDTTRTTAHNDEYKCITRAEHFIQARIIGDDGYTRGVDAIASALVASARASDAPFDNQLITLLTNKRQ